MTGNDSAVSGQNADFLASSYQILPRVSTMTGRTLTGVTGQAGKPVKVKGKSGTTPLADTGQLRAEFDDEMVEK